MKAWGHIRLVLAVIACHVSWMIMAGVLEREIVELSNRAIDLAESGDLVAAADIFQTVTRKAPESGKAWVNLGVAQLRLQRFLEARKSLETAFTLLPVADQRVANNLAALEDYEQFILQNAASPGDNSQAALITTEAIKLAEAGDVKGSLPLFEQAAAANPANGQYLANLGVTQMRLGLLDAALESFNAAKAAERGAPSSMLNDNFKALEEHMAHARSIQHDTSTMYQEHRRNMASTEESNDNYADSTVDTDDAYEDEDDASVNENDDDNDDDGVDDDEVGQITNQGIALAEGGDIVGALKFFRKSLKMDPQNSQSHENVGVTLMRLGLLDEARAALNRAKRLRSGFPMGMLNDNFKALESHEEFAESIGHDKSTMYEKYRNAGEETDDAYDDDGDEDGGEYDDDDEYEENEYEYEDEDEDGEGNDAVNAQAAEMHSREGMQLIGENAMQDALEHFEKAAKLSPKDHRMLENLGVTQMRLSLLDEAEVSFKRARKLSPALTNDNLVALQEHRDFQAKQLQGEDAGSSYIPKRRKAPAPVPSSKLAGSESDIVLDLSKPLGVSIGEDASVDSVKPGGQCEVAGVRAGDRVTAAGLSMVSTLDDFKLALATHKKDGYSKLVLTVQHIGVGHSQASTQATRPKKTKVSPPSSNEPEPAATNENEEVIWRREDGTVPEVPGMVIFKPEQISKISRYTVERSFAEAGECAFSQFLAAYDLRGDLIVGAIDNFFEEPLMQKLKKTAMSSSWEWSHIHPDKLDPKNLRKGNGFPGLRIDASQSTTSLIAQCLKPALALTNPGFNLDKVKETQTLYGLVNPRNGEVPWLDSQRIPHNDIRWDLGLFPNGDVPVSFASVLPLTRDFNRSGTGLWMERVTGLSLLRNVDENNKAQGNMNPHNPGHLHPHLDLLVEVPNPPHAHTEHVWAEAIMIAELRYNRYVFYDGRRLHQQFCNADDYVRLSIDPAKGRLTMNSFFWNAPTKR